VECQTLMKLIGILAVHNAHPKDADLRELRQRLSHERQVCWRQFTAAFENETVSENDGAGDHQWTKDLKWQMKAIGVPKCGTVAPPALASEVVKS